MSSRPRGEVLEGLGRAFSVRAELTDRDPVAVLAQACTWSRCSAMVGLITSVGPSSRCATVS
jgi:hypothetical protein